MAIAVVLEFEGGTLDQYDQVLDKMGFAPGGKGPTGAVFHWCTKTDAGVKVTDVWETREQFEAFAREHIGPLSAAVGLGQPEMAFYDVHNHLTAG